MKQHTTILLTAFLMIVVGCQNRKDEPKQATGKTNDASSCSCLENYNGDATFFNRDFVADIAGNPNPTLNKGGSGKYTYYTSSWEDNGVTSFFSLENLETFSEIKDSYPYAFKDGQLKTLVDYVKKTYRNQSDEETAKNDQILNEQYEKQTKDKDPESEATKSTLQNTLLDSEHNAYQTIENLGDYAVFNKKTNDVYVVCGDVLLQLRGQVGPRGKHDAAKGLELAIRGAKKIINQCP